MIIEQKKFLNRFYFAFYHHHFTYRIKTRTLDKTIEIPYETVTGTTFEQSDKEKWFTRVGVICLAIVCIQYLLAIFSNQNMTIVSGLILIVAVISLLLGQYSATKFTVLETQKADILILRDEQHDKILQQITARQSLPKMTNHTDNLLAKRNWDTFTEVARMISHDDSAVMSFMQSGRSDPRPTDEDSHFWSLAEQQFGEQFREPDEVDSSDIVEVPAVIFKTVMQGFGYMEVFDLQDVVNLSTLIVGTNRILSSLQLATISHQEQASIPSSIVSMGNNTDKIAQQNIAVLERFVEDRDHKILWFDEGADSFIMFIVPPRIYQTLVNHKLDDNHRFINLPRCP